jgi:outer membrane protein assembly factor BamA
LLEGAAFLDGGNVWTIRKYNTQEGGLFEFDKFYKQIACAYGVGLRFDFTFFLFRVDMGVKMYDPTEEKSAQWRFPIKWGDTAFHFAIGYPF